MLGSILRKRVKKALTVSAFLTLIGCGTSAQDPNILSAAKAGYETFQTGDMEAWAKTQAADVHWKVPLGFPYGGEFRGPQEVIDRVFDPIVKYWPDFQVKQSNTI